jgi:hypothetical protein
MLLNLNTDPRDHSACALYYDEIERWMTGVWKGHVDQAEAMRGAEAYLRHATQHPCAYLLNDNSNLVGSWFESLEWLLHVWVPQAERLGLRYVAHIVQADQHHDIFTRQHEVPLPFELQIFHDLEDATHWLASVRDAQEAKQGCEPTTH